MNKKQPVVFDIDGTLTAEDYNAQGLPDLAANPAVLFLAQTLQKDHPLIISTARTESQREETEQWLKSVGLNVSLMLMRNDEDANIPPLVKARHLRRIRKEFGEPQLWVDDNTSVISMLINKHVPTIHIQ